MRSHLGPFRITRVEHLKEQGLKGGVHIEDLHRVYFEDADGLDSWFFPHGDQQRHRGGYELFDDFTYRATVKPRIADEWTSAEIGKAQWESECSRDARRASYHGDKPHTYSLESASPHMGDEVSLIRTEWMLQWPQMSAPGYRPRITVFIPEPTFEQDVLRRGTDLWTIDDLAGLLPDD